MEKKRDKFLNLKKSISGEVKYVFSDVFVKGVSFLALPIFTRYLMPEQFGIVSLFTTLVGIFTILFGLNLWSGVIRYSVEEKELYGLQKIVYLIILNSIVLIILLTLVMPYFRKIIDLELRYIIMAVITSVFQAILNVYLESLRAKMEINKYCILYTTTGISNNLLGIIFLLTVKHEQEFFRILSISLPYIVFGIISTGIIVKNHFYENKKESKVIKEFISYSLPLLPFALSSIVLSLFDRIIIGKFFSNYEVGIYSFSFNIGMIINVVAVGLYKAFQPEYFRKISDGENTDKMIRKYFSLFTFCYVGFVLLIDTLINFFGDISYSEAKDIIPIICFGYFFFFLYSLVVSEIYYFKKTYVISASTIFVAILSILLNYYFVPKLGYKVSAYISMVSFLLLFTICYLYVKNILKTKRIELYKYTVFILIISLVTILKMYM